jgi:P27 family predicted phage terminase small subunit
MGRRPDPAALQEAKGNPGKRRKSPELPNLPAGSIPAPSRLNSDGLRVWEQIAPELQRMNFLRGTDANAFARYCDAVVRFWRITEKLRDEGETYTSKSAHGELQRINPLFVIEERLAKRLESLEDRFGLNPAARQQIMLRLAQHQPQLPFGPAKSAEGEAETPSQPPGADPLSASPIGLLNPPARLN